MLLAAVLVSRSCGASDTDVSQAQAIAIAKRQIDYTSDRTQIRYLKRGLKQESAWAVSLATVNADGTLGRVTVVVVDADTGKVVEVRKQAG